MAYSEIQALEAFVKRAAEADYFYVVVERMCECRGYDRVCLLYVCVCVCVCVCV